MNPTESEQSLTEIVNDILKKHVYGNILEFYGFSKVKMEFQMGMYSGYFARLTRARWNDVFGPADISKIHLELRHARDRMTETMIRLKGHLEKLPVSNPIKNRLPDAGHIGFGAPDDEVRSERWGSLGSTI